jgi:predicted aminopeptidase
MKSTDQGPVTSDQPKNRASDAHKRQSLVPSPQSLALALLLPLIAGCANVGYYYQSVAGQFDIWWRERPISEIFGDPAAPAQLKAKLETVLKIREFASRELGLPDNESYRRYADVGRPFVLWNVFAAREFSVHPERWCFPMVGCVTYRGYFSKAEAERYAAELRALGHDVYVGGVPAYSTLGWFPDPVLNTFIDYPRAELARLVFHELAHQLIYIKDDTAFNESFAVAIEREGVRRWLEQHGDSSEYAHFERVHRARTDFMGLVHKTRTRLDALYRLGQPPELMRAGKRAILDEMDAEYRVLKAGWGGYRGYDRWFAKKPNNAHIASVSIYTQIVPAFETLLAESGGDLKAFYGRVRAIADRPAMERAEALAALLPPPALTAGTGNGQRRAGNLIPDRRSPIPD